ncbi:hypothetical protein HU200_060592 [Digitaria exilis]|uniref:Cytochrome P450 n=1 Tax=Digitaria exilis TaxID=1010633 RepID=A0A835AGA8_9POAL|nr:hypothetical protein HU200_060592 [Digitaria exilis]
MMVSTMIMVAALAIVAALLVSLPVLYRLFSADAGDKTSRKKAIPPGSFGLPVIGHTLSLLGALRANTAEEWLRRRATAYGPVSRLSLFGCPTAFLVGPAANKFVFTSSALTTVNAEAFRRMVGRRNVFDLAGDEHARVRAMMVQFLKLDAVKSYVANMDAEVQRHLDAHWHGRASVAVMPSMKTLTFDVMSTVLFGLERDTAQELSKEFHQLVQGMWTVPIDLPFTRFSRCLAASRRGRRSVAAVIEERRAKLERGESSPADDMLTHMLSNGLPVEEITDHVMFLMVAAHDTTAALITFLLRHLDANKDAYAKVLQEQEEIARCKAAGEALSWEDLCKMRYTWAAAMETLRMVPPPFSMLRKVLADVEYGGYLIPKGWQVMEVLTMTHWDPAIFPDPGRFDPARFDDPSALPPYSFVPFGGGARMCPGNEFSRVETLVAVHYIVTRFRWKLAAGCDGSFSRHPMPYPTQGLLIDINPIH